jgi:MYXO-CTERM domain-containing protein
MKYALQCVAAGAVLTFAGTAGAWVQSTTEAGAPISWPMRNLEYRINSQGSEDVALDKVEDAVIDSYSTWNEPACSDMTLTYMGQTDSDAVGYSTNGGNQNIVVWQERDSDWIHAAGVIGVTTVTYCTQAGGACIYNGAILDADIEMNGAEFQFTTNTRFRTLFDIANTVTHEVGHLLGLDHTGVIAATMYAQAPAGETSKRSLHSDDEEGFCDIYPKGEPSNYWPDGATDDTDCTAQPGSAPGNGGWFLAVVGLGWVVRRRAR